jgi:hypothetical protein
MKKQTLLLLFFIVLKFVLQYALISDEYDLHRDEYLHLDQAKHLAWGYLSVPPFTSWISYVILNLGNDVFWVKFFPALFGALTLYLVWKTIETVGGGIFAQLLGATAVLFSALLRLNLLYQPNSADVFFWMLVYFTLIKYFTSNQPKWLWAAGFAFGFGLLNKYNIAFLALGLVPALLLTPQRKIFANRSFYYAGLFAFFIVLPNLIWQYLHDFPVVHHMNELAATQLEKVNRMDFIKEQILFFFGSVFLLVGGLLALALAKPFQKYRFVWWSYVFTLTLFITLRAKGYYAIGLYPVLIAFGAVYFEAVLRNGGKRYLRPVVVALPVLFFIPFVQAIFPIDSPETIAQHGDRYKKLGLLRWEDGKDHALPQDFADMICWKEMAEEVDKAYATIPNAAENTLVLCDNYGQAGAINFYTRHKSLQAVSFNADYIDWIPKDKQFTNVIAVKDLTDDDPDRRRESPLFGSIELYGSIDNPLAREFGTKIFIYRDANVNINQRIWTEVGQRKNR